MLTLKEIMYIVLLWTCFLFAFVSGSKLECCEPGVQWVNDSIYCKDNRTVSLSCATKSYVVDPNNDAEGFYYVNTSNWLVTVNSENTIVDSYAPDKFCRAHMKSEVRYLVCFPEQFLELEDKIAWRTIFFGIWGVLSGIFLAFTLIIYIILPDLRDLQDKAVMSLCGSFMVAFFTSGLPNIIDVTSLFSNDTGCIGWALIMYYSFLSAFFWLNVISLNIWRSVWLAHYKISNMILFLIYCAIGWGVPVCFLALTLIADYVDGTHIKPGLGLGTCWFNGHTPTLIYFYAPVLALISLNLLYLGLTSWKLWHRYEAFDCNQAQVLKIKCTMCVKLSIVMGATWIFEIISFIFEGTNRFIWFLPDFLNASQGLIIFIFFVILRTKVRKLLAERRPCSIPFPKSWAAYKDHEKSEENYIDEFQLSRTS